MNLRGGGSGSFLSRGLLRSGGGGLLRGRFGLRFYFDWGRFFLDRFFLDRFFLDRSGDGGWGRGARLGATFTRINYFQKEGIESCLIETNTGELFKNFSSDVGHCNIHKSKIIFILNDIHRTNTKKWHRSTL
mgnify:CR=1 FL=1